MGLGTNIIVEDIVLTMEDGPDIILEDENIDLVLEDENISIEIEPDIDIEVD